MRSILARLRPYTVPCLIGFTIGAAFAVVWHGILARQPVPLWLLVTVGGSAFLAEAVVAVVRRRRVHRGRPRRAHARPAPPNTKGAA
jgi:hypothetical protein